jgi:hypothetical protein
VYEDGCISSSYKRKILSIFKTALSDIVKKYGIDRSVLNAIQLPRADYSALKVFSIREQCRIEWEVRKEENKKAYSILCVSTRVYAWASCAR